MNKRQRKKKVKKTMEYIHKILGDSIIRSKMDMEIGEEKKSIMCRYPITLKSYCTEF